MENKDNHDHHDEDPMVDFTVGLIFIAVLVAIFFIALFN